MKVSTHGNLYFDILPFDPLEYDFVEIEIEIKRKYFFLNMSQHS